MFAAIENDAWRLAKLAGIVAVCGLMTACATSTHDTPTTDAPVKSYLSYKDMPAQKDVSAKPGAWKAKVKKAAYSPKVKPETPQAPATPASRTPRRAATVAPASPTRTPPRQSALAVTPDDRAKSPRTTAPSGAKPVEPETDEERAYKAAMEICKRDGSICDKTFELIMAEDREWLSKPLEGELEDIIARLFANGHLKEDLSCEELTRAIPAISVLPKPKAADPEKKPVITEAELKELHDGVFKALAAEFAKRCQNTEPKKS
jgi:hypothetical protein